jgi:hypothetical protein
MAASAMGDVGPWKLLAASATVAAAMDRIFIYVIPRICVILRRQPKDLHLPDRGLYPDAEDPSLRSG